MYITRKCVNTSLFQIDILIIILIAIPLLYCAIYLQCICFYLSDFGF